MELVFCWIGRSKNGFIQEEGFNFYGEHQFSIKKDEKGEETEYVIEYEKKDVLGSSLYKDSPVVTNVSAIVGENGSGKSTLLGEVHKSSYFMEDNMSQLLNDEYDEKVELTNAKLFIYKINSSKFEVFHNLGNHLYIADFENFDIIYNNLAQGTLAYYESNTDDYEKRREHFPVSILYQYYPKSLFWGDENFYNYTEITLSPKEEWDFLLNFLKKITFYNESKLKFFNKKSFEDIFNLLSKPSKRDWLQNITNLIYYHLTSIDVKTNSKDFKLGPKRIYLSLLNLKERKSLNDYGSFNNEVSLIETLYLLLVEEIDSEFEAINISKKYLVDKINNFSANSDELSDYCQIALKEIQLLENILGNNTKTTYCIECDSTEYFEFCKFIYDTAVKETSFSLKYLDIELQDQSSGEQAILTLLSRLKLIPVFVPLIGQKSLELNKNMILLIDEIDLFVHPEWQRKLTNHLINELETNFFNHQIQIILTTHSPFVLSDIPVENCTFLEPKNGKFCIKKLIFHRLLQQIFT